MKPFLIQTKKGHIQHDFAFHLLESINHQNWFYGEKTYNYILSDEVEPSHTNMIPVGSLSFVFEYMKTHLQIDEQAIKPLNIPTELCKPLFLQRSVYFAHPHEIKCQKEIFVKSNERYKFFADIITNSTMLPSGEYLVSEVIELESEWRVFVHQGEMVGLKHYAGDFRKFPDVPMIDAMINEYKSSPLAYTLDVGIHSKGTCVIEVHPFVSCGLYGFQDPKRLPIMFQQGFTYMLREAKKFTV